MTSHERHVVTGHSTISITAFVVPDQRNIEVHITGPLCVESMCVESHVDNVCLKPSRQISALLRLTRLLDLPRRKAIYTSLLSSNFNYWSLMWFFTSRASIIEIQKIQECALGFVLKDSISDHEILLSKRGVDSFRISALKFYRGNLQDFESNGPQIYITFIFEVSNSLQNELIQLLKRTATFGIKSLAYYGTHLWSILPHDIKGALTLNNLKTFMRKWAGLTYGCSVCNLVI